MSSKKVNSEYYSDSDDSGNCSRKKQKVKYERKLPSKMKIILHGCNLVSSIVQSV